MTGPSLPASFLGSMASADAALGERIARGWLSFCPGMALVGEAAERVDVIPLQLLAALVELTAQVPDAQERAMARLQQCQAQRQRLDPWGQQLLEAGLLWSAGALGSALRRLVDLAERAPDGLLVLKIAEWLTYLRGQELHGPALLDLTLILEASHGNDPDWLGIHAFALELCGCCPEAIAAAQTAIGARSLNPWADHALLHAWQRQGDLALVAGPEAGWCWRPAGLTLVEAVGAAACGRRATAWELLAPIRGWIDHAGGSDTQARVLHQTFRSLERTRAGQDGLP